MSITAFPFLWIYSYW